MLFFIIDSLGFDEYVRFKEFFLFVSKAELSGFLFRCLSYSYYTTPSIATLLCGLRSEKHRVRKTKNAYRRTVRCIPEVASELGRKTPG